MTLRDATDTALGIERHAADDAVLLYEQTISELQAQVAAIPSIPSARLTLGVNSGGRDALENALLSPVEGLRIFDQTQPAIDAVRAGYEVIFSFKDATAAPVIAQQLAPYADSVWMTWLHEPEDNTSPLDYATGWHALAPTLAAFRLVPILMGGVGGISVKSITTWVPQDIPFAAIGVDCYLRQYPWTRSLASIATPAVQYARSKGISVLVPEFGIIRPTDDLTVRAHALEDWHTFLANTPEIVFAAIWNTSTPKGGVTRDYVFSDDAPTLAAFERIRGDKALTR